MLAGAGKLEFVHNALKAESEAVLQGLQAASDLGMVNIQVETDAMNLVSALRGKDYDLAPAGALFKEIRLISRLRFNVCEFDHCPRICNALAHELAHFGSNLRDFTKRWVDEFPGFVTRLVTGDLPGTLV